MRKIIIANQKGGVGKTTTAVNLAAGLGYKGYKTLLIDMDPQANATVSIIGYKIPEATVYQLLVDESLKLTNVVIPSVKKNLDLLPSSINLAGAEAELIGPLDGRQRLHFKLDGQLDPSYEFVIIDAPPSLGVLTVNALVAANEVIVPISPSIFGVEGIAKLIETIEKVKKAFNHPNLQITGILRTFHDQTRAAQEVSSTLQRHFNGKVFKTAIPKNVALEEAHMQRQSIFDYDKASKGAEAYAWFVEEVVKNG